MVPVADAQSAQTTPHLVAEKGVLPPQLVDKSEMARLPKRLYGEWSCHFLPPGSSPFPPGSYWKVADKYIVDREVGQIAQRPLYVEGCISCSPITPARLSLALVLLTGTAGGVLFHNWWYLECEWIGIGRVIQIPHGPSSLSSFSHPDLVGV
jgi:hypothetical protein